MPYDLTIHLIDAECKVSFSDDEWVKLLTYARYVDEMRQALPAKIATHLRIHWSVTDGLSYEGEIPPDEVVSLCLHKIRPFVLQDEPTNYLKMRNILAKHFNDPRLRATLDDQRDIFTGKDFQERLKIDAGCDEFEATLNSPESFDLWLNAFEYHRDTDKQAKLEQLSGVLSFAVVRAIFIDMLISKIKAILNLAILIRNAERKTGESFNVPAPKSGTRRTVQLTVEKPRQ